MKYNEHHSLDGVPIRRPADRSYRWCTQCGAECHPDPTAAEGLGIRVAFVCALHGINALVDPFEAKR